VGKPLTKQKQEIVTYNNGLQSSITSLSKLPPKWPEEKPLVLGSYHTDLIHYPFSPLTHSHAAQFLEVMIAYQNSMQESKARNIDLSGTHSWDEVMRLVKDTEDDYVKSGRSGLRRVSRFIGDQSESVLPYLRLIPNGFYTSIICGGLKVIFELSLT